MTCARLLRSKPGLELALEFAPGLGFLGERRTRSHPRRIGVEEVRDVPTQLVRRGQSLLGGVVVGEICCIGEQFDCEFQLLGIYDVRALGEVVGDTGQNVDVLVRDLDFE